MRKVLANSIVILMVFFLSAGLSLAKNGKGDGNGAGGGTGPIHDILSGIPFDVTGDVVSLIPGQGMEISTTTEGNVTIYGVGPIRYWDSLSMDRPVAGEKIRVSGYIVDYNGVERYIAMTIWIGEDEVEVQLRDPDTGSPLWRRGCR